MGSVIKADNIYKIFDDGRSTPTTALEGLSLDIEQGEFVCIVGPSGCGKSTFLSMLAGLDHPTSGQLHINGKASAAPGDEVAAVFQEHSLLPWKNVLQNVAVGLKARGMPKREREQVAFKFLTMAGLKGFEHRYPFELSGGMKQRVAIARALAVSPSVLLMDEPFAALDAQTRTIYQEELLRIYDQFKKTIIFITHNVAEAVFLADRVVVMTYRPGKVKEVIPVEIARPRTLDIFNTEQFTKLQAVVWENVKEETVRAFQAMQAAA